MSFFKVLSQTLLLIQVMSTPVKLKVMTTVRIQKHLQQRVKILSNLSRKMMKPHSS